jgi:hypothetical protein
MANATIEIPPLTFTAHCQVRYIERFLDKEAVRAARRRCKTDSSVLQALSNEFDDDLRHFRHVVQVAYFNLIHKIGKFVDKTAYRINLGPLSVCIEGNVCKTTICKKLLPVPPPPEDDDPMQEPIGEEYIAA